MLEISQPPPASKNQTDLQYSTLDKTHTLEAEPASEDQTSSDHIAAPTMLEPIQATSYSLEARTSKTRETKFNLTTSRWTIKTRMHLKFKWLLLQATRFISKSLLIKEIILILMEIKFKDSKISWKIKNF